MFMLDTLPKVGVVNRLRMRIVHNLENSLCIRPLSPIPLSTHKRRKQRVMGGTEGTNMFGKFQTLYE